MQIVRNRQTIYDSTEGEIEIIFQDGKTIIKQPDSPDLTFDTNNVAITWNKDKLAIKIKNMKSEKIGVG